MITKVGIQGAEFYAYHGYYDAEQLSGNAFIIDAEVNINTFDGLGDNIADTVNYERIYKIIEEVMKLKQSLLETVVFLIIERIKLDHPDVLSGRVRLEKLSPQLGRKVAKSFVEMEF